MPISIHMLEKYMLMNILLKVYLPIEEENLFLGMDLQSEYPRIPSENYDIENYQLLGY